VPPNTIEKHGGRVGRSVFFTVVSGFQMNLVNILAAIIAANVLERYPHIRIAFGESGCGWIPYALDRMDFEWEDRFTDLGLKMKPSTTGAASARRLPVRPHRRQADRRHGRGEPDVGLRLPARRRRVAELRQVHQGAVRRVSPEVTRMITCTNAGKFYGLIKLEDWSARDLGRAPPPCLGKRLEGDEREGVLHARPSVWILLVTKWADVGLFVEIALHQQVVLAGGRVDLRHMPRRRPLRPATS
jgi:hypothetical protein